MASPAELEQLQTRNWTLLQERLERYQSAWRSGTCPDLSDYLPPPGDANRLPALHEFIKTDLEIRWRRGLTIYLEEYLKRFPELGGPSVLPAAVLYEEYRVRQLHGDHPALDSYRSRFPARYAELVRLIQHEPLPTVSSQAHTNPIAPFAGPGLGISLSAHQSITAAEGYRPVERIGSGSFGEVWKAEAPGGVQAALKIVFRPLKHEEAQRELGALEIIKNVRHPALLATHSFWPMQDRLVIAMELADGSLRDRLKESVQAGALGVPVSELLRYFQDAAEGLDFLHERKVLHRDIKPENLLLLAGHVKVADFGLARMQNAAHSMTVSGSGTPVYMAPETWRGRACPQSDQYSLAIAWVELRRGRRPFGSESLAQMMFDHLEKPPDLEGLDAAEKLVVTRALAKDPEQRYPTCSAFVNALAEAFEPPAPPTPLPPAVRRWKSILTAAGILIIGGLLLFVVLGHRTPQLRSRSDDGPEALLSQIDDEIINGRFDQAWELLDSNAGRLDEDQTQPLRDRIRRDAEEQVHQLRKSNPQAALVRLKACENILPHSDRDRLARETRQSWLGQIDEQIGAKRYERAGRMVEALLQHFHDDPEALKREKDVHHVLATLTEMQRRVLAVLDGGTWNEKEWLEALGAADELGRYPEHAQEGSDYRKQLLHRAGKECERLFRNAPKRPQWKDAIEDFKQAVRLADLLAVQKFSEAEQLKKNAQRACFEFARALPTQTLRDQLVALKALLPIEDVDSLSSELKSRLKQDQFARQEAELDGLLENALQRQLDWDELKTALGEVKAKRTTLPADSWSKYEPKYAGLIGRFVKRHYAELPRNRLGQMMEYCEEARAARTSDSLTLACLCECLLRLGQEADQLKPSSASLEKVRELIKQARFDAESAQPSTTFAYLNFVLGLARQAEAPVDWLKVKDLFGKAKLDAAERLPWQTNERCLLAAKAYYEAGLRAWQDGAKDRSASALPLYQAARRLNQDPTDKVRYLPSFVLAAHEGGKADQFRALLRELTALEGYANAVDGSDLAVIGRYYVEWAEADRKQSRELLVRMLPALQKAAESPKQTEQESIYYWLACAHWGGADGGEKAASRPAALRFFGRALAGYVPERYLGDEPTGRLKQVEEVVGKLRKQQDRGIAEHWLGILTDAIPADPRDRSQSHWDLVVWRGALITAQKALLRDKRAQLAADAAHLIAHQAKKPLFLAEGRLLAIHAINADEGLAGKDKFDRMKPHWRGLGQLLLAEKDSLFDSPNWRGQRVEDLAEQVIKFLNYYGEDSDKEMARKVKDKKETYLKRGLAPRHPGGAIELRDRPPPSEFATRRSPARQG